MKFKVSRTSNYDKPCENAVQERYTRIEVRVLNSFEKFDEMFGRSEGTWLSKGINHCINDDGYIQRDIPNGNSGWFIEINSLEELAEFNKTYGDIILYKCWSNPNISEIEIYDDYRE